MTFARAWLLAWLASYFVAFGAAFLDPYAFGSDSPADIFLNGAFLFGTVGVISATIGVVAGAVFFNKHGC